LTGVEVFTDTSDLLSGSHSPAPDFSPLTVDQLRTKTADADPNVRWGALFELGRRNGDAAAAIAEVTARLADDRVEVRRVAVQTIGIILMHSNASYWQTGSLDSATRPPLPPPCEGGESGGRSESRPIVVLKANADADETVKAGVRIALAAVAAREK
jgi:hypothetical protein